MQRDTLTLPEIPTAPPPVNVVEAERAYLRAKGVNVTTAAKLKRKWIRAKAESLAVRD